MDNSTFQMLTTLGRKMAGASTDGARLVLVDGMTAVAAAKIVGVNERSISRAVRAIKEREKSINKMGKTPCLLLGKVKGEKHWHPLAFFDSANEAKAAAEEWALLYQKFDQEIPESFEEWKVFSAAWNKQHPILKLNRPKEFWSDMVEISEFSVVCTA